MIKSPTTLLGELKTDDCGQVSREGVIVIGRTDDVILSGGVNIHPQEIENTLFHSSLIEEVAVAKFKDTKWGERPVAFVVLKQYQMIFQFDQFGKAIFDNQQSIEQAKIFAQELTRHCKKMLSPYKAPAHYIFVNHLPKNPLGKISRKSLISAFDCEQNITQDTMLLANTIANTTSQNTIEIESNSSEATLEIPAVSIDHSPTQPLFFEQIDISYDLDPQQIDQKTDQQAQLSFTESKDQKSKDQKINKG
jgi:long-subunit acyl-CoA synthetase (AMP-forming)